jgi:RNA helicase.
MKNIFKTAHIEKCIDPDRAMEYCQKEATRKPGTKPRLHGFPKPLKLISDLRPWQKDVENIIKTEADDRSIYWIWETEGNVGKTAFAKYICSKYNALYCAGKSKDIKFLITQYFEQDETNKDDLTCIFDYTRSMEEYISYESIESIKNGIFTSTKYETKMVLFNSPHIFIFA